MDLGGNHNSIPTFFRVSATGSNIPSDPNIRKRPGFPGIRQAGRQKRTVLAAEGSELNNPLENWEKSRVAFLTLFGELGGSW